MQLKDFLRIDKFDYYSLRIEGEKTSKIVTKEKAFESYGWMNITEIDFGVIFINKGEDIENHKSQVVPKLLLIDKTNYKSFLTARVDVRGLDQVTELIKATREYIIAVDLLVDKLNSFIEEDKLDNEELEKRINVVKNFKENLGEAVKNFKR